MPAKIPKDAAGGQPKKLDQGKHKPQNFTSVEEIRAALRVQSKDRLVENLTALRNQLYIRPGEDAVSPQDDRLLLAQHWIENVPGAHDIFEIWDGVAQRQNSMLALLVAVLSSLLTLLSSHYTFQALGQPIMKSLLTPAYMRRLNSYIGGSHAELILVTLRLLNEMSAFAGGRERKSVLESFGWEMKSLPKLLNMRRKGRTDDSLDAMARPDIRTLYILFLLSFVDSDCPAQIKSPFLEQHRDPFLSIFKGLVQDSYVVVRKILEVCWNGIWSDPKIKRTVKIGLFSEITVSHIVKLYDRTAPEDDDADHIPADLVHHFLLAICTRPGVGICFRDRGWYPRETDGDEETTKQRGGKIYNKILANILKSLKVNEDVRQQELALKIMTACPELISGYWTGAALTLEPRLASKWIANISFFGSIISLPVPTSSFYLPNSTLYQPSPPPLSNIIENIFPSVNTKAHLSKGLQSTSGLVQHCTALALAKCLTKYEEVLNQFHQLEIALEENEADGQWCKRRRDIEREARRRAPDFQVIVAFSQQKFTDPAANPNPTKAALLSESAQRLLWMYQRCLPLVVAEARFDVGKLLQNFSSETSTGTGEQPLDAAKRLDLVRQLHVLRLLKDSDQFGWSAKMGSSSQSYLAVLLKAYIVSEIPATRMALSLLLQHILSESILFQEDPDEPHLWLISLPTSRRARGTESPDGAALTDEGDSVVAFLDDCVQRCLKTPYKYIEELYALGNVDEQSATPDRLDTFPSPLLMTVLEQLEIKVSKKSLSASDVLALASFVRKLGFRLSSKQQDLHVVHAILQKFDAMLQVDRLFPEHPVITRAIRREVALLRASLQSSVNAGNTMEEDTSPEVQDFLAAVEQMPTPATKGARIAAAFELIDWLRLVEDNLRAEELKRVSALLAKFHPPSLPHVAENVNPAQGSVWPGLDIVSKFSDLRPYLQFDFLFLHSTEAELVDETCRKLLAELAVGAEPTIVELKRVICLVAHRLSIAVGKDDLTKGIFLLLASIIKSSAVMLSPADFMALKEAVFVRSSAIKSSFINESLSDTVVEGLRQLVETLDSTSNSDRCLIAETSAHWLHVLRFDLEAVQVSLASMWIRYFQTADLFILLDTLVSSTEMPDSSIRAILSTVLEALRKLATSESEAESSLKGRLPQLLTLRPILAESLVLEELIAIAIEASLPAYCDGHAICGAAFDEASLLSVVKRSETRWSRRLDPLTNLPIHSFLTQDTWTPSTVKIVSGLIYKRSLSKEAFVTWLATNHCTGRSAEHFIDVMYAFLDTYSSEDEAASLAGNDDWASQLTRLLEAILDPELPQDTRSISGKCICLILQLDPSSIPAFIATMLRSIERLPVTTLSGELLVIGRDLHTFAHEQAKPLLTALVDHGIQWAVRLFADEDGSFDNTVNELSSLAQFTSGIKPHLVETVMGVAIQNQLSNPRALDLIAALLSNVPLKPVVVNRHLQSVLQHPHFFKLCAHTTPDGSSSRDSIVRLLHVLFNLHPANTCQPTHVEPLVRIYRGTLSLADGLILSIFRLFETERKVSIASLLGKWSSSPNLLSSTSLEAIQSLDAILVLRTCLNFPRWRHLEDLSTDKASSHEAQLYDPLFLILLFAQTLAENPPVSAFAWVELFRTNIVSLLIKALSSKDGELRDVALCQLTALWQCLQTADMQEKPHVLYILTLLKDVLPPPSEEPPRRLPSYTTLLLLHALRGIFYPSNFIYPITARFLLQRPELDTSDVPMLYNMLYSSSDDWKKDRGWIIRFLSDGLMSTDDWRVLKRRHTWDLLASLFQSSEDDRPLRAGVFEVLASLTCNAQATTSLVLKSGLLAWIEIQLITSKNIDGVEWVKILENIMTIATPEKLESSTNGEWRKVICRCLSTLLDGSRSTHTSAIFPFAIGAILRLSLLPGSPVPGLPILLNDASNCIQSLEVSTVIPPTSIRVSALRNPCTPLYRAHEIHEAFPCEDSLQIWGMAVEALWRVAMTLEEKPSVWDAITGRILVWRALVGADGSTLGEWARTQVIRNMAVS